VSLTFGWPPPLLLLLLLPGLLWLGRRRLYGLKPSRRRLAYAARGALFGALVLALAEPRLGRPDDRLNLAFVVDGSASVQAPRALVQEEWVEQAAQLAGSDDRTVRIDFGRWAEVQGGSAGRPAPDATNLAEALDLAGAVLAEDGQRRVVLLTDGQQNLGQAREAAARLAERGIELSYLSPEPGLVAAEVLLRGLEAPAYVREGETLQVDALVQSTHVGPARLRLWIDEQPAGEQEISLREGLQRVTLTARPSQTGFRRLRAEVAAEPDAVAANNTAEAFTVVKEAGRVLLLESRAGEATELEAALRATGLQVEVRPTSAVPPSAAQLQVYESIVLVNVPNTALSLDQQLTLQSYVSDYGRGLLVVGGHTSYSLGAYQDTPLGELLPVDPTPPARRELGSVALFLVIDKSGSMDLYRRDVSKMAMAREAAILATEALNPNDQVGVLAFDARHQWVVPTTRLQTPADVDAVKGQIATIVADGGTNIFPALEAAYQAARQAQARLKHIVLLTDGQSPDDDYAGLIARMKADNVTLTTVAVGGDSDLALLTRLAQLGDGRHYFTERPDEIPRLVTRETTIVSRSALVEGLIQPRLTEPSPLLADLQGKPLPAVGGYVATTPRPRATTVLTSDRGDPLLASWQYGLGRVVAWTADGRSEWSREWLAAEDARRVWAQAVRWSMAAPTDPAFQLSLGLEDDRVRIGVQALEPNGSFADRRLIRATVTTPAGQALEVPLRQVGPGRYEFLAQALEAGVYTVQADEVGPAGVTRRETGGFVVPAAAELRTLGTNRSLLEQLAQLSGGRELVEPADAYRRPAEPASPRWTPLWPWLLALALATLPLDVALRRLSSFRR
jgi:Mg-chelatase subunit ChlD/uncharacterized membrane protein